MISFMSSVKLSIKYKLIIHFLWRMRRWHCLPQRVRAPLLIWRFVVFVWADMRYWSNCKEQPGPSWGWGHRRQAPRPRTTAADIPLAHRKRSRYSHWGGCAEAGAAIAPLAGFRWHAGGGQREAVWSVLKFEEGGIPHKKKGSQRCSWWVRRLDLPEGRLRAGGTGVLAASYASPLPPSCW